MPQLKKYRNQAKARKPPKPFRIERDGSPSDSSCSSEVSAGSDGSSSSSSAGVDDDLSDLERETEVVIPPLPGAEKENAEIAKAAVELKADMDAKAALAEKYHAGQMPAKTFFVQSIGFEVGNVATRLSKCLHCNRDIAKGSVRFCLLVAW
jgi:hypothetical protein